MTDLPDCARVLKSTDMAGVREGALSGDPAPTRDPGAAAAEPPAAIDELRIGDTLIIGERPAEIDTRTYWEGTKRFGISPSFCGTVATLYVDRDPYLFDVCNGPLAAVPREEVTPDAE